MVAHVAAQTLNMVAALSIVLSVAGLFRRRPRCCA